MSPRVYQRVYLRRIDNSTRERIQRCQREGRGFKSHRPLQCLSVRTEMCGSCHLSRLGGARAREPSQRNWLRRAAANFPVDPRRGNGREAARAPRRLSPARTKMGPRCMGPPGNELGRPTAWFAKVWRHRPCDSSRAPACAAAWRPIPCGGPSANAVGRQLPSGLLNQTPERRLFGAGFA